MTEENDIEWGKNVHEMLENAFTVKSKTGFAKQKHLFIQRFSY